MDGATQQPAWRRWLKPVVIIVAIIALLVAVRYLPIGGLIEWLETTVARLGIWGIVLFIVVYIIATVLMLPGATLTLVAGAIFGLWWGTAAVSIASTTGAALAFLIGRYLARATVERKLAGYPKFKAVDRAVSQGGWKIVALLRLSPAVPFNLQNYLYGLTAIRFWPCVITSWLAMLPGTFMYIYLGYAGRASVEAAAGQGDERSTAQWVLLAVGLLATVVVTVYITKLSYREIKKQSGALEEDSS